MFEIKHAKNFEDHFIAILNKHVHKLKETWGRFTLLIENFPRSTDNYTVINL